LPLITAIEFPDFGYDLRFPPIPAGVCVKRDFQSLDINTQSLLREIMENTTFKKFPAEEREILWEKRHYLHAFPSALPKVLLSAQLWDFTSLSDLQIMMDNWAPLHPTNALQLLLPW
jgi:phosphatidylinositol-4-phosphate 3-kinase